MNTDIRAITDALESEGVFTRATLLDPESIVNVAMTLATLPSLDEYSMWLSFFAARHDVSTYDLATDVLTVLAHAGEFVDARIVRAAQSEVVQLAAA